MRGIGRFTEIAKAFQPHLFGAVYRQTPYFSVERSLSTMSACSPDNSWSEVCIVAGARTPIGGFQGSLAPLTATELGAIAIKGALSRGGVDPSRVDEVFMGNVLSAGLGQAPSRQAAIAAGLPHSTICTDVNKVCASGMKAVMLAAQSIQLGHSRIAVAGGMESMSNVPYYLPKARTGFRLGNAEVVDGLVRDGLWDPHGDLHMGSCAERCAEHFDISRETQDQHAAESWKRAKSSFSGGSVPDEIIPVEVRGKRSTQLVTVDDALSKMDPKRLPELPPAFETSGSITAGNASPLSDGAAALVLTSRRTAEEEGLKILATIRGFADAAQAPEWFTTAPAQAVHKALDRAGVAISEVDFFEINEAFSVVDLANQRLLGIPPERVNVNGGAVAIGHPIGCSGARILVTLLHVLRKGEGSIGVASICNGGGGASAVVLELAGS